MSGGRLSRYSRCRRRLASSTGHVGTERVVAKTEERTMMMQTCTTHGPRKKAQNTQPVRLTETTASDVSGNEDRGPARLKLRHHPVTFLLLLVTVDGKSRPPILAEIFCEVVGDTLGTDKDENLGRFGRNLFEMLDEPSLTMVM
jgi:hypothetical protein